MHFIRKKEEKCETLNHIGQIKATKLPGVYKKNLIVYQPDKNQLKKKLTYTESWNKNVRQIFVRNLNLITIFTFTLITSKIKHRLKH